MAKGDFELSIFGAGHTSAAQKREKELKKQVEGGKVSGVTAQRLSERLDRSAAGHDIFEKGFGSLKAGAEKEIQETIAEDIREQDPSLRKGPSQSSRILSTNIFDEEEEGGKGLSRRTLLGI